MAGQQHGMVCLDAAGEVVRPALLWNDTRSAAAADDLVRERGADFWAEAVGSVPVASFTAAKLRWLARNEPGNAERTAAVCLPHDWLTWRLRGESDLTALTSDRSDASGTGYWAGRRGEDYRSDLLALALGRTPAVPRILGPAEPAGVVGPAVLEALAPGPAGRGRDVLLGPGAGDNAAAALGLGAGPGDVVVSLGTSGTVFAVCDDPTADPTGTIAGFADATGRYLPLVCTLNAARVLTAAASTLGVSLEELSRLALSAPAGAEGLTLIPYLEGERTPNFPDAAGSLHGIRPAQLDPGLLRAGLRRGDAVRARRRARRAGHRRRAGPARAAHRRRGPLGGRAAHRAGGPRPPGQRAAAGGVRGRRRRPAGRVGPVRRRHRPGVGRRRRGGL